VSGPSSDWLNDADATHGLVQMMDSWSLGPLKADFLSRAYADLGRHCTSPGIKGRHGECGFDLGKSAGVAYGEPKMGVTIFVCR